MKKTLLLMSQVHLFTEPHLRDYIREEFPDEVEELMDWLKNYWIQKGREQWEQQVLIGRQEEAAKMALRLIHHRIGNIPATQQDFIRSLPLEQLRALSDALFDFTPPVDLNNWLATHTTQK